MCIEQFGYIKIFCSKNAFVWLTMIFRYGFGYYRYTHVDMNIGPKYIGINAC